MPRALVAAIHLGLLLPITSSDLPGNACGPHDTDQSQRVSLFGLALDGVYPATSVAKSAVRSYRTISPLPLTEANGGIFSVALSVGSHLPGVTWHPVL